ncbi:hypothetical protein OIU84_006118 [Salix udensis]|uniref:Uncharacterized protein n=1 Tax=Salix udensis TaxID=889485 RepID=A0AAD6JXP7_9ROSI|nr:hypothetical protein OIU84_006118 [Salix udensis]
MMQEMWNAPPGFRPTKSAPSSPEKPLGVSRTRFESFHAIHKVPVGDSPYVRAKNVQLVDKDPEKAVSLFWAAINAGDRVDSALKDMAIVMKQQNRAEEAIEAIKSLRHRCSDQAQESLDNILLDLYKRCGRLDDQIALLKHKLCLIQQGLAFNGKRTKTARSQGKKFQVSVGQEATRLLGNMGWALMQQNNYIEAEDAYRRALTIALDNNKMCNLGICLMKQGRIGEAKETLRRVKPAVADGPRGVDSHLKAYERAQQMLKDLESEKMMSKEGDRVERSRLFDAFLGSSSIWQPQPCRDHLQATNTKSYHDDFVNENVDSNIAPIKEPIGHQFQETLKRTRSGRKLLYQAVRLRCCSPHKLWNQENPNQKTRRLSDETEDKLSQLLPDNDDFEEAVLAAILGPANSRKTVKVVETANSGIFQQRKIEKRLKVFQDITPSLSPRA